MARGRNIERGQEQAENRHRRWLSWVGVALLGLGIIIEGAVQVDWWLPIDGAITMALISVAAMVIFLLFSLVPAWILLAVVLWTRRLRICCQAVAVAGTAAFTVFTAWGSWQIYTSTGVLRIGFFFDQVAPWQTLLAGLTLGAVIMVKPHRASDFSDVRLGIGGP